MNARMAPRRTHAPCSRALLCVALVALAAQPAAASPGPRSVLAFVQGKSAKAKQNQKQQPRANTPGQAQAADGGSAGPASAAAQPAGGAVGPKRAGVIRIGVALPQVTAAGETEGDVKLEEAFRLAVIQTLRGPGIEAVPLRYQVKVHAATEARQKQCDYLLFTAFDKKKNSTSLLGKAVGAASALGNADLPGRGEKPENVKKGASSSATVGSEVSNWYKVGDRATLNYELLSPADVKPVDKGKLDEKIEKAGENVVGALLIKAANQLLPKVMK